MIAQQVAKVYPQAISTATNVVPDIYERAESKSGWVALKTNVKKGERVEIITSKERKIYEVTGVAKDKFQVNLPEDGPVFVYGREVKDFHLVDYDALAMLNISATQELAKRVREMSEKIKGLEEQNASLREKLAETVRTTIPTGESLVKVSSKAPTQSLPVLARGTQEQISFQQLQAKNEALEKRLKAIEAKLN